MPRRRTAFALIATLALASAGGIAASGSATAGPSVVRYASPTGSPAANCTKPTPCDLITAINQAPLDSEVIVENGSYGSAKHPLTTTLATDGDNVIVRGSSAAHPPTIHSAADNNAIQIQNGDTLSDIVLDSAAGGAGLYIDEDSTADDVAVYASTGAYGACSVFGTLTDSLCVESASDGPAIGMEDGGSDTATLRGVTAVSTGTGSVGLKVNIDGTGTFAVNVTNSIVHGTLTDVEAGSAESGITTITLDHSDFHTDLIENPSPGSTITSQTGVIQAAPKFVAPAKRDFREAAGSPTIDKGVADPATETALGNDPRTVGVAPDMGAYEFLPKPTLSKLDVTKTTAHVVRVSVKVNPGGLATHLRLVATHRGHHVRSRAFAAGKGRKRVITRLVLRGLRAGPSYQLRIVASNLGGHTSSDRKAITTR
jgi:hypothetical protein